MARVIRNTSLRALAILVVLFPLAHTTTYAAIPAVPSVASFPAQGNLDCNGFSAVQQPLRVNNICADFLSKEGRGEDNGHYIGHDEPSMGFYSNAPGSGNNMQWLITLPKERSLPATQTFENQIAFWFSLALCDPNSYPQNPCIPDSDKNHSGTFDPLTAGSAFLEMQFYPPGNPPFINQISCDLKHWCASLHINSLECTAGFASCNPNCIEPTNFAFIQRNGVPTGPPGPVSATNATFTPDSQTLLMNQGDRLRITIKDTKDGMINRIDDLTTGQSGFMVSSAANGFQSLDVNTCAPTNFTFRPEFATAKFGNFVPWAALQANVNFASEIGHFTPGANGDGDADDAPCFPGPTVAGCLNFATGGDTDFDGSSYLADWPDGTRNNATSLRILSVVNDSVGPASVSQDEGQQVGHNDSNYSRPYPSIQFETDVLASESTCNPDGSGCTVPPPGAAFYPFFTLASGGEDGRCSVMFGNDIAGATTRNFGRDAQYGSPNLPWFFGTASSGQRPNPCRAGE